MFKDLDPVYLCSYCGYVGHGTDTYNHAHWPYCQNIAILSYGQGIEAGLYGRMQYKKFQALMGVLTRVSHFFQFSPNLYAS